jgi:hypothetical protein
MSKNEANQETEAPALPAINVAKIATTESLSGLSTLEYHVGYLASNPSQIHFRIWKNSGGGKFNTDWIGLAEVEKALSGIPAEGTFTAAALAPIAVGKSVNTSSFIGAALLAEGLIVRSEKVARSYERNPDTAEWWSSLRVLIEAGTNLAVTPIDKPVGHKGSGGGQGKPGKKQKPATASLHPVE